MSVSAFDVSRCRGGCWPLFPDAKTLGPRAEFVLISVLSSHYEAESVSLQVLQVNNECARDIMVGEKYDSGVCETLLMQVVALSPLKDISGLVIGEAG